MTKWRAWVLFGFLLAGLLPVFPILREGHTLGPFGQMAPMVQADADPTGGPWDVLQADSVLQFYGWRDLVLSSWRSGQVPTWNPYQFGGNPLLANSQSGGFYPPHILLGILQVPTGLAILLLAVFHLTVAGLGVAMLARRVGASREGAVVAGLAFAWSPFLLAWLSLGSVPATVAWIPWLLVGTLGILNPEGISRVPFSRFAGTSLAAAMLITAGHLQFAAYGFMAVAVLLVGHLPNRNPALSPARRALTSFTVLTALAMGVGLAAPQLLPVLAGGATSHRRNVPTAEGYQAYVASAIRPGDVLSRLINPMAQGSPVKASEVDATVSAFWPAIAQRGANYAESAGTLGAVVIGLLFLVPWRRLGPAGWSVAAVGLLGVALAVGTPLNQLMYQLVPGWSSTGSPGRAIVLFVMAGCVVAGRGIRGADDGPISGRVVQIAGLGLVLLLAVGLALGTNVPAPPQVPAELWIKFTSPQWGGWLVGLLAAGLALLDPKVNPQPGFSGVRGVLTAIVFATIFSGTLGLVRGGSLDAVRWAGPAVAGRAAFINQDWELMVGAPALMPPNLATINRIQDLAGYDSLTPKSSQDLLAKVSGQDPSPPANGNLMFVKPTATPVALMAAGVTDVFSRTELPAGAGWPISEATPNGWRHTRLGGPGLVDRAGGPGQLTWRGLGEATVEVPPGSGPITVRIRNLPGWRASMDGRSLAIPAGDWIVLQDVGDQSVTVRLDYAPPGLGTGLIVGGTSFLCLIAAIGGVNLRARQRLRSVGASG